MTTWLNKLRENLRTQDNRSTAWPVFCVQQKRRLYGMDPDWADVSAPDDGIAWMFDGEEVDAEERVKLETNYDLTGEEPDGYTRTSFQDIWEFVTACFTEQGAKDYLAVNGHNLKEPRIYVESAWRNEEWQRVSQLLQQRCQDCAKWEQTEDPECGECPHDGPPWIETSTNCRVLLYRDGGTNCGDFEPKEKS